MCFDDLQVLWVTPCRRRSTQTCLSPQTGVITGGGHWGALTTTAYWTLGVWSWPWKPSVRDKSRPSSTEWISLYIVCIFSLLCTNFLHAPAANFLSPGSLQTRAGAGSRTTSPSSPFSSRAWRPSQGPRPWTSACGASGPKKTASPCGWLSLSTSRASLQESVSRDDMKLRLNVTCCHLVR